MSNKQYAAPPALSIDLAKTYTATIETVAGTMELELYAAEAPMTVNNFVFLAREGFYDNVIFHRVIKGFMIQGGDPLGQGFGGPGYAFADEFHGELQFDAPYILAMANSGPGTNGSQFFITVAPTTWLNRKHTIFGAVKDAASQAVVDKIGATPTGGQDVPVTPVVINSVTIA